MPATTAFVVALLKLVAAPGFGGWFASVVFDALRRTWPCPAREDWSGLAWWQREAATLLWSPRHVFWTSKALAFAGGLIAAGAAGLLAYLVGGDVQSELDQALAAVLSGVFAVGVGEARHQARKKSDTLPGMESED
jgi:hypothetical protein